MLSSVIKRERCDVHDVYHVTAWGKEKNLEVSDRIRTHDLPRTGRML